MVRLPSAGMRKGESLLQRCSCYLTVWFRPFRLELIPANDRERVVQSLDAREGIGTVYAGLTL